MENNKSDKKNEKDSLGISIKKSPWLLFAILQIPIVIGMIIFLFVLYRQSGNE